MSFFHQHKFGEVQKDGYQYCQGCGVAKLAPVAPCNHIWETIETSAVHTVSHEKPAFHIHLLRCKKCGNLKNHRFGGAQYVELDIQYSVVGYFEIFTH